MDCNSKASILKLKALREKLCLSDSEKKKAFEVRHYVVKNLKNLQLLLDSEEIEKKECSIKLKEILEYYEENNSV